MYQLGSRILGQGTYGQIISCSDGINVAKRCTIDKDRGITNLVELYIMSAIRHPHLAPALNVILSRDCCYIIQRGARGDLWKERKETQPPRDLVRSWMVALTDAVHCLHRENIIHADIKARNVLLYENGSIALTDFGLSTYDPNPILKHSHTICTVSHAPPECLEGSQWDRKVDIWSLGCTFYELLHGRTLIPSQEVKIKRSIRRKMYLNAIHQWKKMEIPYPDVGFEPIDYISSDLDDLILPMLHYEPSKRPDTATILKRLQARASSYSVLSKPLDKGNKVDIIKDEAARIIMTHRPGPDPQIMLFALDLYARIANHIPDYKIKYIALACYWMGEKFFSRCIEGNFNVDDFYGIRLAEREICSRLRCQLK